MGRMFSTQVNTQTDQRKSKHTLLLFAKLEVYPPHPHQVDVGIKKLKEEKDKKSSIYLRGESIVTGFFLATTLA